MTLNEKSNGFLAKAVALLDSLMAQQVKNFTVVQETQGMQIRSLQEDSLEKEMAKEVATHSSILDWRIPMEREAWQATAHGVAKSQT